MKKEAAVTSNRILGIDALRIVTMLMIVVHHVVEFGDLVDKGGKSDLLFFETWLIEALCFGAVNCYALISGYVGVKRKPKMASLMTMWLQVAGYSTGLVIVMELLVPERVNMSGWPRGLMPVVHDQFWYFTAYVFLFLMMPILNELLLKGERFVLRRGIASVLGGALVFEAISEQDLFGFANGYSVAWLAVLYMVGGYFRLYGKDETCFLQLQQHGIKVYLLCSLIMALLYSLIFKYRAYVPFSLHRYRLWLYNYMSVPVVISSVALFAWFSAWVPGTRLSRWIVCLAPATFGVYIIHMQANVWEVFLNNQWLSELSPAVMPIGVLSVSLVIYVICTVIDLGRIAIFRALRVNQICQWAVDHISGLLKFR